MSTTIVFRGLMVFHKMGDHMEIGVLNAPAHAGTGSHAAHVPRIIKTTNGVISSIFDLRNRNAARDWEIEVSNPLQPTATRFRQGEDFDRRHHPIARDFRWIADLEGDDLHNRDLTAELDMTKLLMVIRVRHGMFYTQQLSKPLNRKTANPPIQQRPFGRAAEVVGCQIDFEMGSVTLKAGTSTIPIYTFDEGDEDGVVYEISNAPPDVAPDAPYVAGAGHFAMYYTHLFGTPPQDEFRLIREGDPMPSPDPALCGAVGLGKRSGGI